MNRPTTRRQAIATLGGGLGGGVFLGGCERDRVEIVLPEGEVDKSGWIDAHVHVWTPDLERYPLGRGFDVSRMKPPSFTVEELLAECGPHGVSRVVLVQPSFYRSDHSYLLHAMDSYPGSFGGVALVDEAHEEAVVLMKYYADRGIKGFRVRATLERAQGWKEDEGMRSMWAAAAEYGWYICCLANADALPAIQSMCEAFPETPVVIDHCGRIGTTGTIDQADLDVLSRLADFGTVHVKTSAFYALGQKASPYEDLGPMIRQLRDAFGPERLMWATDCPYQVQKGHTYGDSIALIRDRLEFLSESDREWMLRRTAEKVFFG